MAKKSSKRKLLDTIYAELEGLHSAVVKISKQQRMMADQISTLVQAASDTKKKPRKPKKLSSAAGTQRSKTETKKPVLVQQSLPAAVSSR